MQFKNGCGACFTQNIGLVSFFLERVCSDCRQELITIARGESVESREALILYLNQQGVFIGKYSEPFPENVAESLSTEELNQLAHWLKKVSGWNLT
jgi:hypothetical protein